MTVVQSEFDEQLRIAVGERVRAVGAEQPPPLHGPAVERLVAAEVAEVERALEREVAHGLRGRGRHAATLPTGTWRRSSSGMARL